MIKNRNIFFLQLIFLGLAQTTFSQVNSAKKGIANGVYFTPTQLVFSELLVTYERFSKPQFSINYSLGVKIATGSGTERTIYGDGIFAIYEYQHMFNEFANGLYASVAIVFQNGVNFKSEPS